jgi:cytochrome c553
MRTTSKAALLLAAAFALSLTLAQAEDGKVVYEKSCASCHGKEGKGDTKMGQKAGCKDYSDAKNWAGLDEAKAFKAVKEGLSEGDKVMMKPFAEKLSDDDIKAANAYMRTLGQPK